MFAHKHLNGRSKPELLPRPTQDLKRSRRVQQETTGMINDDCPSPDDCDCSFHSTDPPQARCLPAKPSGRHTHTLKSHNLKSASVWQTARANVSYSRNWSSTPPSIDVDFYVFVWIILFPSLFSWRPFLLTPMGNDQTHFHSHTSSHNKSKPRRALARGGHFHPEENL